ncbi:hypothetical protein [Streptomyces lavendofoliae]|uniref:Uncharacterized protein n=1 Tax=Streptomyces lavendofoliae TaxID=67314 RepID=A0A918I2J4_9ACTN|nr:hypothetical protein [Streptomyces lavendofoliae]GGU62156.1 hypothetical protein GCM10010274_58660 [Streptomyces lavendofoliae]
MANITPDQVLAVINLIAHDDDLYDRFINATDQLNTPRAHDGHAPEALTVEQLAADIASAA